METARDFHLKHPALDSLFSSLLYSFFLLASVEQIIFSGDSKTFFSLFTVSLTCILLFKSLGKGPLLSPLLISAALLYFLWTENSPLCHILILILLGLASFRSVKLKAPALPLLFLSSSLGLLLFSFLANVYRRDFFRMASEPVGSIFYPALWALLALTILCARGFFLHQHFPYFQRKLWILLSSIALLFFLFPALYHGSFSGLSIDFQFQESFPLASCFAFLTFFAFSREKQNPEQSLIFPRIDVSILSLLLLSFFLPFVYWTYVTSKEAGCVKSYPQYEISADFAFRLLAAEDRLFPEHHGFDFEQIRKATRRFVKTGSRRFGASSISMQLAKVCYLDYEKTFLRKWNQIIITLLIELRFTKDDILKSYLESIPFSPDTLGLREAAEKFFQKSPADLSAAESLGLILSIQNPHHYNVSMAKMPADVRRRKSVIETQTRAFSNSLKKLLKNLDCVPESKRKGDL